MGRLVMLLILTAGLPGILLGTGLALLAFESAGALPLLSRWNISGDWALALSLIVMAVVLAATGAIARGRVNLSLQ